MMIWTWRIRRSWWHFILWSVATLITFVVLLVAAVNWQGARAWQQAKTKLEAAGEDKTFDQYVPALPADDMNFFAIPALRELCVIVNHDPNSGWPAEVRKRFHELHPALRTIDGQDLPEVIVGFASTSLGTVRDCLYQARGLAVPASTGSEAKDVLVALDATRPLMKEMLAEVNRPQAQLVRSWRGVRLSLEGSYGLESPLGVMGVAEAFHLRARAALATGDARQALDCARVVLRLTDAFSKEPGVMGELIASVLFGNFPDEACRLVASHALTDDELALLQHETAQIHVGDLTLRALREELAMQLELLELFEARPFWRRGIDWRSAHIIVGVPRGEYPPASWGKRMKRLGWDCALAPAGTWSGSKAVLANTLLDHVIIPLHEQGVESLPAMRRALRRVSKVLPEYDGRSRLAGTSLNTLAGILDDFVRFEVSHRQTLLVLAIERYRLAHQEYPASLGALVPAFMSELPRDLYDNQLMHYKRGDAAHYEIRSCGSDGKLGTGDDLVITMPMKAE